MKKQVSLVIGDWSSDGHGKTDTFSVQCECSADELEKAYQRGVEKIGVSLEEICHDYEDNKVPKKFVDALMKSKVIENPDNHFDGVNTKDYRLSADSYAELWVLIANFGLPSCKAKIVEQEQINIGGYGLYWI